MFENGRDEVYSESFWLSAIKVALGPLRHQCGIVLRATSSSSFPTFRRHSMAKRFARLTDRRPQLGIAIPPWRPAFVAARTLSVTGITLPSGPKADGGSSVTCGRNRLRNDC